MRSVLFTIAVLAVFVAAIVFTALCARAAVAAESVDVAAESPAVSLASASDSEFAEAA